MFNWLKTLMSARCPICRFRWGGYRAHRLHNERILGWLGLYPFECRSCNYRFYALWFCRSFLPLRFLSLFSARNAG